MVPVTEPLLNCYVLGHSYRSTYKEKVENVVSNFDWKIEITEWALAVDTTVLPE